LRNIGRRERRELVGIGTTCDDLLELLNLRLSEDMLDLTLKYRMRLSQRENHSEIMVSHWKVMVRCSAVKIQRTC
jgi:hypothetical protein